MKVLCFVCAVVAICSAEKNTVTVQTSVGAIKGFLESVKVFGETYEIEKYLGIPYAEVPTGERRFQKPVPKAAFTEVYSALQFGSGCWGIDLAPVPWPQSEDCLFLNVFVPVMDVTKKRENLPVMIWIHGGGFLNGASTAHQYENLSTFGSVIVVTINYRLAIFGFYSTGDDSAPGNYGLWDQQMAIKWVYDNIQGFGGDSEKITIAGFSAGSASVIYQSLYSGNQGLFQRAIGQSGSVTSSWAMNHHTKESAIRIGNLLGCNISDTWKLTECLRYMSAEHINQTINDRQLNLLTLPFIVGPTIDGEFLMETPWAILNSDTGKSLNGQEVFSSLDLMMGVTEMDGALLYSPLTGILDGDNFEGTADHFRDDFVPRVLPEMFMNMSETFGYAVFAQYFKDDHNTDSFETRAKYVSFSTDVAFAAAAINTLSSHAQISSKNRYLYNFHPRPATNLIPAPSWVDKAYHGDEILFCAGFPDPMFHIFATYDTFTYDATDQEVILSKAMMTAWSNFIKTGNPNLPSSLEPYLQTEWPVYDLETEKYLNFTLEMTTESGNGDHLYSDRMQFWLHDVPAILESELRRREYRDEEKYCQKEGNCPP